MAEQASAAAAATTANAAAAAANAATDTQRNNVNCVEHAHNEVQPPLITGTSSYKTLVMMAGFASVGTAILLIVMKFLVWIFSGSTTILASLTDSLIDLGASFINLLALRFALRPADKEHRFGHYKAEALASLTQSAFICGSALLLIVHGYDRFITPKPLSYINIAIYVSIASVVITIGLTWFQGYVCKITQSEAVAADRFHYLSDVGLNVSVIVALVLSNFGYDWADGLITIFLGLYIMHSSWHIGHTAIATLLDKSLSQEENVKIIRAIVSVPGIESFHDLRTRKAGPQYYIQCHIVLNHNMSLEEAHNYANEAERNILEHFPDADITLHMEPDVADTFKDITFVDQQFCTVPAGHYSKNSSPSSAADAVEDATAATVAAADEAAAAPAANKASPAASKPEDSTLQSDATVGRDD